MKFHIKRFISNDSAVSEEFTALPTLTVVMIGFTLFSVLIAQAYGAYIDRQESVDVFQEAIDILDALLSPNSPLLFKSGVIDVSVFYDNDLRQSEALEYFQSDFEGAILLSFENSSLSVPSDWQTTQSNRISASKNVAVMLNEVETVPGILSVVVWRNEP